MRAISEGNGIDYGIVEQFDTTMRERYPGGGVEARGYPGRGVRGAAGQRVRAPDEVRSGARVHRKLPSLMGQGGARDIMCEGLLRLPEEMLPMLRAVVHDEAVFSVPEEDWESYGGCDRGGVHPWSSRACPSPQSLSRPGRNWAHAYRKGDEPQRPVGGWCRVETV